jgi:SAM-dependent methyltransferase
VCRATDWQILFQSNGFDIGRCGKCGVARTLRALVDGVAQYPPFEQQETLFAKLTRTAVGQLLRERVRLCKRLKPSGRLLDFGCGSGSFARMAAGAGYDVVGLEPFSLGKPGEEPRLRLLRAPLEACKPELGKFDLITMWHVLEHIPEPAPLVASLIEHLAPDGILLVSVPNFASWQSRVFRGAWFHLDPPRHITHFDEPTLGKLLGELGLEVVDRRTFHLEYGPVGWLQSALNRVAPRHNFLFELVKDRGALADVPKSELALNLAVSAVTGALVAAPALLVEVVAGLQGAGSVVTLAVRRAAAAAGQGRGRAR